MLQVLNKHITIWFEEFDMTASKDRPLRLMSPDVDKYFGMLKDQFSLESSKSFRRSSSAKDGRESSLFRKRFEHLSSDISPKYHRHSMVEGNNIYPSKQRSLDLSRSTEQLNESTKHFHDFSLHMAGDNRFSNSYTSGDFRDLVNNNESHAEDLQSKHMETALNQGKLYSFAEESRRRRKKVFDKERKSSK